MKKTLAILLTGLLSLCIVSCASSQEPEGDESNNNNKDNNLAVEQNYIEEKNGKGKFEFDRNENGDYEITNFVPYAVKASDITLPTKVNEVTIAGIADNAFKAQNAISGVTIPATYEYVGDYAFYDCDALTKITFEKDTSLVKDIGRDTKLESIGKGAFESCDLLEGISIPAGVTEILEFTFKDCKAIRTMDLSSIEKIQKGAFFNCTSITTITVSDNLKYATKEAFYGCDALKYNEEAELLYLGNDANKNLLLVSPKSINLTECKVSDTTKVIADAAFANCKYFTTIELSDSIEVINGTSFTNCPEFKYTKSENGLYIGNEANPYMVLVELDVHTVEGFKLNKDTKIIADSAFVGCQYLTTIEISDAVKILNGSAFEGCANLTYNKYENGYYIGSEANPYMVLIKLDISSVKDFELHKDAKIITETAFAKCNSLNNINFKADKATWEAIIKADNWNNDRELEITCEGEKEPIKVN